MEDSFVDLSDDSQQVVEKLRKFPVIKFILFEIEVQFQQIFRQVENTGILRVFKHCPSYDLVFDKEYGFRFAQFTAYMLMAITEFV